ncbi:MAG: HD domain-containing protein [Bacillota bacterium]|nr:HD domain-containing protein [Bacillota bacterium]
MDGILGSEKRNLQDPNLRKKADLARTLQALSVCLDFSRQGLLLHHRAVAFTAWEIGKVLGLQETELFDLYCAALIHDGGVRTTRERLELEQFDVQNPWDHCRRGREILRASPLLRRLGKIVFHHHDRWEGGNPSLLKKKEIPLASRIIHLADRIDVLRMRGTFILHQTGEITRRIQEGAGKHFDPELVEAYSYLADREVFWLDLAAFLSPTGPLPFLSSQPAARGDFPSLSLSDLDQLALFFARVIDEKSSFTYRHSRFVAELAAALAAKLVFLPGIP